MTIPFKGVINVDIRDSTPDWAPYIAPRAPEGAPNVLIVLYDDTGLAAWSPFGGRIEMPTLQRLADNGILAIANASSRVLDLIGVNDIGGAVTIGLAHYSTAAEVDQLVRALASLG